MCPDLVGGNPNFVNCQLSSLVLMRDKQKSEARLFANVYILQSTDYLEKVTSSGKTHMSET